ncbi:hypothetical protein ACFV0T_26390 [Streptomyces sp. NPDC059582]|uniref:hypothetical protein n=1 Tax=Streptomyces sp. NPDC059582 TaxID=3346875 RepID=UPI0036A11D1E
MNRITIYGDDLDGNGEYPRLGWFDLDSAQHILEEDTRWNGQNMIGVISGMQINRADLYRTSGGRWVEHQDHRPEFNGPNMWRFLTDEQAREWMLKSGGTEAEKALERWFPETPEEQGPNLGGRPVVGPKLETRVDEAVLAKVDAAAKAAGTSRAAWLRDVIEAAVA